MVVAVVVHRQMLHRQWCHLQVLQEEVMGLPHQSPHPL